jgi:hypothetical protein
VHPKLRPLYNASFGPACYRKVLDTLERQLGPIPFRMAETPLLLTHDLRDRLVADARAVVAQLSSPAMLERCKAAIPERYRVPGMDALPNTAQVDFALVQGADGRLEGKLIELQGFPSLYALETMMSDAFAEIMAEMPGLAGPWTCLLKPRDEALDLLRRTLLGGCDPEEVVLVDIDPPHQKTAPDFAATKQLFGIDAVCVTSLEKRGRALYRRKDGRRIPVRRIYNRMVFDEIEVKKVPVPFRWGDDLDVTWCSHPNWYWVWSKYCLPWLDHPSVPRSRLLSEIERLPEDLSRYVLKPLFSFAGSGVVIDVTREAIDKVPADQRDRWVLQEKIEYAPAIRMPEGTGVKAEVRVMFARPPEAKEMEPLILLVRLSRGKMLGVDYNHDLTWVGGTVGMWLENE